MKLRFYSIFIIIIFNTACAQQQKNDEELSLSAEVINIGFSENPFIITKYFDVKIKVSNNTKIPQSFWIMKCSWEESFRTNIEDITFSPRECVGNFPTVVTLRPNSYLEFLTIVRIPESAFKYDSFKIGLVLVSEDYLNTKSLNDKKTNVDYISSQKTFWSNSLLVDEHTLGYDTKKAFQ